MKRHKLIKSIVLVAVFGATLIGFSVTKSSRKLAGESLNVTVVSLSTNAQAFCNEQKYDYEFNNGICVGAHNEESSYCREKYTSDGNPNCIRIL